MQVRVPRRLYCEQPVLTLAVDIQVSAIVPEHGLHQLRYPRCCQQNKAMSVGRSTQAPPLLLRHNCLDVGGLVVLPRLDLNSNPPVLTS